MTDESGVCAVLKAGDEYYSEAYSMCLDHASDIEGNPTIECWRFSQEDDSEDAHGHLHIRVHEIIETANSGTLVVYYRRWILEDGEPVWGKRPMRKIGSLNSLKQIIRRRSMTTAFAGYCRENRAADGGNSQELRKTYDR